MNSLQRFWQRWRRLQANRLLILAMLILTFSLLGLPGSLVWFVSHSGTWPTGQPVLAQRIRIDDIWQQVYQQMPELPLENQYVSRETGEVSVNNTLVNRLIRYHIYVKSRLPNYRLDWKLTLADYLGVNEKMDPERYPSGTALRENPMPGDVQAIQTLNRAQRNELVNLLVTLFTPAASAPTVSPSPTPAPSPAPVQPTEPPRFPQQPQPGDAQLLQP